MAARKKSTDEYPTSAIVKNLKVAASAVAVAGVFLDLAVPIVQQMSKDRPAKSGLEPAIRMTILVTLARGIPRLIGAVRTFRSELDVPVVGKDLQVQLLSETAAQR